MLNWLVYLVKCSDGTKYCGATNNIEKRLRAHNAGTGAKYTRTRRPVLLLATSELMSKGNALRLEHKVKKQKVNKKVEYLENGTGTSNHT